MQANVIKTPKSLQVSAIDTLIEGKPAKIECLQIGGQTFSIQRGPATVVRLEDEWYDDIKDPEAIVDALRGDAHLKPDIFTFWQRLPDLQPRFKYYKEWESIAVLPVSTYDHWWSKQISSRTRNLIRKAQKEGLEVRDRVYDDEFVQGMTEVFNETPIRQGRPFWHYGKDYRTVQRQFSRFIYREEMIGAYYQGKMIGFMMIGNAGPFALVGQIISMIKHRDKSTNNAMIAKAVELCERKGWPNLVYLFWSDTSLAEFKRRCGFEENKVPRYFVPLTAKGRMALKLGLHRGWKGAIPEKVKSPLKRVRKFWFDWRAERASSPSGS